MKLLFVIFFIGLFLRVYNLGEIPAGIHGDEASIGYNAYSLMRTFKDQNGNFLPLVIDQFGDYRPAGYHYLAIPFISAMGLNSSAIRIPSVLFGSAMIILMYFLTQELFRKKWVSFVAAFFLAISPWHIIISRATSEGVVASFFIMTGIYMLLSNVRREQLSLKSSVCMFICFFLSFLFYHTARIFVPLFFVVGIAYIFMQKKLSSSFGKRFFLLALCVFLSLGLILLITKGAARPSSVSIFNIPGGDAQITQQIGEDGTQHPLITRFFHNKVLFYLRIFISTYFQHIDGGFLFGSTGKPLRYEVPWSSVMYLADLPLVVFGFAVLLTDGIRRKKYIYLIPIVWLVFGALPAGLTYEDLPNVQRASLMIPAIIMISAFGLSEIFVLVNAKKSVGVTLVYGSALGYFFLLFIHNYFYHIPKHEPWHRSAAQKELIPLIVDYEKQYKHVVMTTEGNNNFIFYLFYRSYDPAVYQSKGSPTEKNGLTFENVTYYYQKCPLGVNSENPVSEDPLVLFVNKADCKTPINADVLNTIHHPDGTPAYLILKVNPYWKPKEG